MLWHASVSSVNLTPPTQTLIISQNKCHANHLHFHSTCFGCCCHLFNPWAGARRYQCDKHASAGKDESSTRHRSQSSKSATCKSKFIYMLRISLLSAPFVPITRAGTPRGAAECRKPFGSDRTMERPRSGSRDGEEASPSRSRRAAPANPRRFQPLMELRKAQLEW